MHTGALFNHETIALDGESFEGCEFRACRLVYSGGAVPVMTGCRFEGCEWKLEGAAADTLAHLKLMWVQGAKAPVQALIKEITSVG